jgi:hypothetical protein
MDCRSSASKTHGFRQWREKAVADRLFSARCKYWNHTARPRQRAHLKTFGKDSRDVEVETPDATSYPRARQPMHVMVRLQASCSRQRPASLRLPFCSPASTPAPPTQPPLVTASHFGLISALHHDTGTRYASPRPLSSVSAARNEISACVRSFRPPTLSANISSAVFCRSSSFAILHTA